MRCTGECYLQASVQHGVGASLCIERLLFLQLDRVLGVKPEEVDQLCGSVDLGLDHRLPLVHNRIRVITGSPGSGPELPVKQ